MDSDFIDKKVMVTRETGEPQCGTIVGETPRLFAVHTDIGDIIMVEKRYTYPYDAEAFQRIKDVKRQFLEARTALESAWGKRVPLVPHHELRHAKGKLSDIELMEITRNVVTGQLKEEQAELTFKETDVQPLLKGDGNGEGSASGPVTIVRSVDELSKVKEGDVLVAESVTLDWPWFQAAMLACALVEDSGDYLLRKCFTLSWEVGIPCIRGAREVERALESSGRATGKKGASEILTDSQIVTVDSMRGEVYTGSMP